MSEPRLTCFDCGRSGTLEELRLFPWWDEHAAKFDAMRCCRRCVPKARKAIERSLRRDAARLAAFHDFVRQRVSGASSASPDAAPDASLAAAERALDALATNAATVRWRC